MSAAGGLAGQKKPERAINSLEIEGIPVEFPFEPYSCQVTHHDTASCICQCAMHATWA